MTLSAASMMSNQTTFIDRLPAILQGRIHHFRQHAARRSFAWNVSIMLVGTVAGQAVSLLLSPVLTRLVQPDAVRLSQRLWGRARDFRCGRQPRVGTCHTDLHGRSRMRQPAGTQRPCANRHHHAGGTVRMADPGAHAQCSRSRFARRLSLVAADRVRLSWRVLHHGVRRDPQWRIQGHRPHPDFPGSQRSGFANTAGIARRRYARPRARLRDRPIQRHLAAAHALCASATRVARADHLARHRRGDAALHHVPPAGELGACTGYGRQRHGAVRADLGLLFARNRRLHVSVGPCHRAPIATWSARRCCRCSSARPGAP